MTAELDLDDAVANVSGDRARRELEELRAHCQRLQEAVGLAREPCRMWYKQAMDDGWEIYSRVRDALNETPEQSLIQVRSEVAEACLTRIDQFATEKQDCMDEIQSFADEIRSGER